MLEILVSTPHPHWPLSRQLPRGTYRWGNTHFYIDEAIEQVDGWVVLEDLTQPSTTLCSPSNTLLVTGEPPSLRRYRRSYIEQFAHVISCHSDLTGTKLHLQQQGLPWHIGVDRSAADQVTLDWDMLETRQAPLNRKLLSVICTNKNHTRDHKARQQFVGRLKERFGDQLDVFGRGYREVADKWEAIAPYQFHIVLENDSVPHYFTEKLTDAILGWAYPIYYGCPNIYDYFPRNGLTTIDIHQPEQAIATIEQRLKQGLDNDSIAGLNASRDLVLNRYNFFAMIDEFWKANYSSNTEVTSRSISAHTAPRNITLYPRRSRWLLQAARVRRWGQRLVKAA